MIRCALKVPRPLPLDKFDGAYDEVIWAVAQATATVLLEDSPYGLKGRPPEVQGHDLKLWTRRDQQYRLGSQLAHAAASIECFACLKAGIEHDQLKHYIGRS